MCLIVFAWQSHPRFPLVLAANRDEYHDRASARAAFWNERRDLLGGRDLQAGGTWLGLTRTGRIAAVTNVREATAALATPAPAAPSRGALATDFLCGALAPKDYAGAIHSNGKAYRGFNLLIGDRSALWWVSNRGDGARRLGPGIYGVANDSLDTPSPKVVTGKQMLERLLATGPSLAALLALLADTRPQGDEAPSDAGGGLERERTLSPLRIVAPDYGTRCSSALLVDAQGAIQFAERGFDRRGAEGESLSYEFRRSD